MESCNLIPASNILRRTNKSVREARNKLAYCSLCQKEGHLCAEHVSAYSIFYILNVPRIQAHCYTINWCSQGCGKSKINSPGSHHVRKCKSSYNLHALYQENKAIINSYNLQSASLRWKGFMRQKSITHQINHQKKYQRRKVCPGCLANGKGKKKSIRRILNLFISG